MREPARALRHTLRDTCASFGATHGAIAVLEAGRPVAELRHELRRGGPWDLELLTQFIRHTRPAVPRGLILRPITRRGGAWGVLALSRDGKPYGREEGRLLGRVAQVVSDAIEQDGLGAHDRRSRCHRSQACAAAASEGPLLPDPPWAAVADPLRSFVGASHSRRARAVTPARGGTDCLDKGQERSDRAAPAPRCGDRAVAARRPRPRLHARRRRVARVDRCRRGASGLAARLQPRRCGRCARSHDARGTAGHA